MSVASNVVIGHAARTYMRYRYPPSKIAGSLVHYHMRQDDLDFVAFRDHVGPYLEDGPPQFKTQRFSDFSVGHVKNVGEIIGGALESAVERLGRESGFVAVYALALDKFILPLRRRSARDAEDIALRDADHYLVGVKRSKSILLSRVARFEGWVYDEGKLLEARLATVRENFRPTMPVTNLPASAPGGQEWQLLGARDFRWHHRRHGGSTLQDIVLVAREGLPPRMHGTPIDVSESLLSTWPWRAYA